MSVTILKRTKIIRPRKNYCCVACNEDISGEHFYVSQICNGDFQYYRIHEDCEELLKEICSINCGTYECDGDIRSCYEENNQLPDDERITIKQGVQADET